MTTNTAYYIATRETSPYNKYMKWHLSCFRHDKTLLSSEYFRTQRQMLVAVDKMKERGLRGCPIGNRMSYTKYIEF